MSSLDIFVPGIPVAQGSMVAVTNKATGRAFLKHGTDKHCKSLREWRTKIATEARIFGGLVIEKPVRVSVEFTLPRPPTHLKKNGDLRKGYPELPILCVGDIDKLARSVLDALTGPTFKDDSQVVILECRKRYERDGDRPGVRIVLEEL